MNNKLRNPRDFWAGLIFIVIGVAAAYISRDYPMGTGGRMGAGYFPTVLSYLLATIGLIIMGLSFTKDGPPVDRFAMKPLILVLGAVVVFGLLAKTAGLFLGIVALVFISAAGGHEFKFKEVAIASIVLAVFCVLVFVMGLKLPFPIWPAFVQG